MTPEELALELKSVARMSVIHPLPGCTAARLAWLATRVTGLLPKGFESEQGKADRMFQVMIMNDA